MNFEKLMKKSLDILKVRKPARDAGRCPSEEDIASLIAGRLRKSERENVLDHVLSCDVCDDNLKNYFQLATYTASEGTEKVPEWLVAKVKRFVPEFVDEGTLEAVIEFGRDFTRVIRTTGMILTDLTGRRAVPAGAFRDVGDKMQEKSVTISKVADNFILDIKIERVKQDLANVIVFLKDKKSKKPSSGERVSLVFEGRELGSSLTVDGKVEFENIELKDYNINLIRRGDPVCIATVFLKTLDK
ncbi:MAG: hypothetical protein ISS26_04435 [Candidatus Omnitrophica bacterium]|nr:hypothetical protein [Candidatus Omnitrophota bacterium]